MSTTAQQKFFTSLAQFARSTADLLDEMGKVEVAEPAAKPAKAAKPAVVETPKPAPVAAVAAALAPVPVSTTPPPAVNGAGDLQAQCRKAAKGYAEVYGREGLKDVLKKYTEGTLADVPAEKLPELLVALS